MREKFEREPVLNLPIQLDSVSAMNPRRPISGTLDGFNDTMQDLDYEGYEVGMSAQPGIVNFHGKRLPEEIYYYSADYVDPLTPRSIANRLFVEAVKEARRADGSTITAYPKNALLRGVYCGLDRAPIYGGPAIHDFVYRRVQPGLTSGKRVVRIESSVLEDERKVRALKSWNVRTANNLLFATEINSNVHKDHNEYVDLIMRLPSYFGFSHDTAHTREVAKRESHLVLADLALNADTAKKVFLLEFHPVNAGKDTKADLASDITDYGAHGELVRKLPELEGVVLEPWTLNRDKREHVNMMVNNFNEGYTLAV